MDDPTLKTDWQHIEIEGGKPAPEIDTNWSQKWSTFGPDAHGEIEGILKTGGRAGRGLTIELFH